MLLHNVFLEHPAPAHPLQPNTSSLDRRFSVPVSEADVRSYVHNSDPKIYQWKLKFSGETDTMSIESFLGQLDMKRIARNLSWDEIFVCAVDLFEGTAQIWYQLHRREFNNWEELVMGLRNAFREHNYYTLLWKEIMNRLQGSTETVISYVSKMRVLFNRLAQPAPEQMQINVIIANASSKFQEMLNFVPCRTLAELENSFQRLEILQRCGRGTTDRVEPDLAQPGESIPKKNQFTGKPGNSGSTNYQPFQPIFSGKQRYQQQFQSRYSGNQRYQQPFRPRFSENQHNYDNQYQNKSHNRYKNPSRFSQLQTTTQTTPEN